VQIRPGNNTEAETRAILYSSFTYGTGDKGRNAYKVVVRNPEGKRQLGRPTHRWEDSIKMGLKDYRGESAEWI
jgi:hypothetical protein